MEHSYQDLEFVYQWQILETLECKAAHSIQ